MTTTALALATVTPVTLPATKPDTYKVVLAMKTPELKQYVRDRFDQGQRICDELKAALQELKDRAKTDGVWQQTLLDCGINPGTWRQWQFRDLNKLTVGTRTGNRNPKPKIIPSGISTSQIAAQAALKDAHEQLDKTAAGDGVGAEQAKAIIKKCEIEAGVSTEKIEIEDDTEALWKAELVTLLTALRADKAIKHLNKSTQNAIEYAEALLAPPPVPKAKASRKATDPCVPHNLIDCSRCLEAEECKPKAKRKGRTSDPDFTPDEIATMPPLWEDEPVWGDTDAGGNTEVLTQ